MSTSQQVNGVFPGRYTAITDDAFVVFLIGMRVNKFLHFRKWLPVASAMAPMMRALAENPQKGYLGSESFFRFWPTTSIMVTYWRSFDDLEHFAKNQDDPHLEPWRQFNKNIGSDGTVGIWHETYIIEPGNYECVYGNMPEFGLAKAMTHVPVSQEIMTARQRIRRKRRQEQAAAAD
ncbi:MAG: DUF4188 domain-containing protein [Anaerolineae bacterium]|nr:DUF4188 domain-containing protein [Anaerolineae bacterium]MCA9893340.1 DUF4188 domain-containing protein [Anaerolineae bacterium]